MYFIKLLLKLLLTLIVLVMCVLAAAHYTGHDKRTYITLQPTDTLHVAGKTFTAEKLAHQYKPEMYLRPNTPTPPLKWVWYEATPNDSTIDLTYHFAWEDEINPNKTLHIFYSMFRAAYYGYPLYDIEYFQVNVNKKTGLVKNIRFETGPDDNYFPTVVKHIKISFDRSTDGNYYCGNTLSAPLFDSMHVKAGVQTWNHLSRLLDKNVAAEYSLLQNAPLKFLTDEDFSKYKFVRKSQGDHFTSEDKTNFYLYTIVLILGALATLWHILDFKTNFDILNNWFRKGK
jgi:hypothetical protein